MSSPTDRRAVSQPLWTWLMRLHALTAGNTTLEEAEARVDLVAGLLAQRFSDDVFTERSLEEVASRCRFWPAYGELVDGLREFARVYVRQSSKAALPAPQHEGRLPPDETEKRNVRETIEILFQEQAAQRVKREALDPGPAIRPLPDVTAKGEALVRMRASGAKVKA